jgi:adenylate kinase family enzyme
MIVHIDGVQGSGKSYLCSKIKVKCVDTDEILDKAFDII